MKEILKVNTAGTGNEKLTDIFNTKRQSVFPVLKTLKKSLRCFAHLRHKYVGLKANGTWIKNQSFLHQFLYRNSEI